MRRVKSILLVSLCLAAATANAQLIVDPDELSQINMCALPGGSGVNLIGCSLKFNSLGEITFTVKNRGDQGINTATGPADLTQQPGRKAPTGPPIEFNLYLQDKLIVTLYQPALGAGQSRTFTTKIPSNYATMIPKCAEARALKLHIDPKNQVAEASESDNILLRAAAKRPCPDLAIKSIKKNEQGLLNETYGVRVTVINRGNATAPANAVWGTSLPDGVWPITGWPELVPVTTMKALEPGETTSFAVGGSVTAGIRTSVRVVVDYHQKIEELEEGNNMKDERL
jgi:CARDB protein